MKYLSRTKVIVQIVDVYDKIRIITEIRELSKEITNYDPDLIKKVKWLALNKIDLINTNKLEELKDELGREFQDNLHIYCISAAKKEGTQQRCVILENSWRHPMNKSYKWVVKAGSSLVSATGWGKY